MSLRASATAGAKPKAGAKKATATATATTDAVADVLLPSLGNLRLGGKKPAATDLGVMGFEVHSGNTEGGMRNMDPASPYGWVNVAEALSQHGGRVPNAPSAVRLSQQPDAFDTGLNVALRFGATYALPDVATWPPGKVYAWSHMGGQYRNMNGSHAYGFFDQTTLQHMATNAPADLRAYQEFLGRMCAYVEDVIEEADDPTYRAPPGTPAEVVDFPQGLLNAEIAYPLFPNSGANEAAYPAEYAEYMLAVERMLNGIQQQLDAEANGQFVLPDSPMRHAIRNFWLFDRNQSAQWNVPGYVSYHSEAASDHLGQEAPRAMRLVEEYVPAKPYQECLCLGRFRVVRIEGRKDGLRAAKLILQLTGNPDVRLDRSLGMAPLRPLANEADMYREANTLEARQRLERKWNQRARSRNTPATGRQPMIVAIIQRVNPTPDVLRTGSDSPWYALFYNIDSAGVARTYTNAMPALSPAEQQMVALLRQTQTVEIQGPERGVTVALAAAAAAAAAAAPPPAPPPAQMPMPPAPAPAPMPPAPAARRPRRWRPRQRSRRRPRLRRPRRSRRTTTPLRASAPHATAAAAWRKQCRSRAEQRGVRRWRVGSARAASVLSLPPPRPPPSHLSSPLPLPRARHTTQ